MKLALRSVFLVTALSGALASGPARADSAAKAAREAREAERNRVLMMQYADCVVERRHARAREAILSNASKEDIKIAYKDLIIGDCLSPREGMEMVVTFGGDLYRYALADALVQRDLAATTEASFAAVPPLTHLGVFSSESVAAALANAKSPRRRAEIEEIARQRETLAALSQYGECIARADSVGSKAWLLAEPNSPGETAAINSLRPVFSSCYGGSADLRFNRVVMRGLVAINYYRLAMAQPSAVTGNSQ